MPYEKNHRRPKQSRHAPWHSGIFIHGGSSELLPRDSKNGANRFSITFPTRTPDGAEISEGEREAYWETPEPTFQKAVQRVLAWRESHPIYRRCPVYACTDLIPADRSQITRAYSWTYGKQRIA